MQGILAGLKVVDLTQNVAGPFCTQTLADLGATVIKIERPGSGDDTRAWMPPKVAGQSSTFVALNRNKACIGINIADAAGRDALINLVRDADVFVQSMKPGSAERFGLGYEQLKAINPRLVYCAISAFGSIGPLSALPGYDPLMQAFTGVMSTTGNEGEDPVRVGVSLIDMGTGMWATIGILGALLQRATSGAGTNVEASLLETGVGWMSVFVGNFLASGQAPKKLGSAMAMTAPYELFQTADGSVFIAAGNDRLFACVCAGLGVPALAIDARFATNPDRVRNRAALRDAIEGVTSGRSTAEVVAALRASGAPCSELHSVEQMLDHEQVRAMGIVQPLPMLGALGHRAIALPVRIGGTRGVAFESPHALGADTDHVLGKHGYSPDTLASLRATGAIG